MSLGISQRCYVCHEPILACDPAVGPCSIGKTGEPSLLRHERCAPGWMPSPQESVWRREAVERTGCGRCALRSDPPPGWHCAAHDQVPLIVFEEGFCMRFAYASEGQAR